MTVTVNQSTLELVRTFPAFVVGDTCVKAYRGQCVGSDPDAVLVPRGTPPASSVSLPCPRDYGPSERRSCYILTLDLCRGKISLCPYTGHPSFCLVMVGSDEGYITHIHLDERYRGQGYGKRLYRTAMLLADELGFQLVSSIHPSFAAKAIWESLPRVKYDSGRYRVMGVRRPVKSSKETAHENQPAL